MLVVLVVNIMALRKNLGVEGLELRAGPYYMRGGRGGWEGEERRGEEGRVFEERERGRKGEEGGRVKGAT